MLNTPDFEAFRAAAEAARFTEVLERTWPADTVPEAHVHPFAVQAVVVRGEMWLTVGGATRHLLPGDTFALARDIPHSERYGPTGTAYWVARRN